MATTSSPDYSNAAQQRILKVLDLMFGHEINGLAPGEIAKSITANPSAITRDLANLVEAGMVEEIMQTGRYRITPRLASRVLATLNTFDAAKTKLNDLHQRYTKHS